MAPGIPLNKKLSGTSAPTLACVVHEHTRFGVEISADFPRAEDKPSLQDAQSMGGRESAKLVMKRTRMTQFICVTAALTSGLDGEESLRRAPRAGTRVSAVDKPGQLCLRDSVGIIRTREHLPGRELGHEVA